MIVSLSRDEYRLALLGAVDFEGDWQALGYAARFVVDGERKGDLIRLRLMPVVEQLAPAFEGRVDVLSLIAARYWFRNGELSSRVGRDLSGESLPEEPEP